MSVDYYTQFPFYASLAVIAGCVLVTIIGGKMIKGYMAEDAAKAEIENK